MSPATGTGVTDLVAWLAGAWSMDRVINDGDGRAHGTARFTDDGQGGLRWQETGRARLGGHEGPVQRTLGIVPGDAGRWAVRFQDGRSFHELDLRTGAWAPEHRCGPDIYRGEFAVLDDDRMTIRWRVSGPDRDDVIDSAYRRLASDPE